MLKRGKKHQPRHIPVSRYNIEVLATALRKIREMGYSSEVVGTGRTMMLACIHVAEQALAETEVPNAS